VRLADAQVRRWAVPATLVTVLIALSLLVTIDRGAAALAVDRPVTHWAVGARTTGWTAFFRGITNLGNPGVAFTGGLVLVVFTVFRSRLAALLLLVATLVRPLLSTAVKDLTDRARPPVHHLVVAGGASYPSGHVLAATVFWGAVPATVLVWSAARGFVRTASAFAVAAVIVVAASRVYLGVHWLSDVIAGALFGSLLLVPLYRVALSKLDR
jgi:undecaprenyl-diphosphatase